MDLVIQVPEHGETPGGDNYTIRRITADYNIALITNMNLAKLFIESFDKVKEFPTKAWDEYFVKQ